MKVCVSGAAGFIGSNLVHKLVADGHQVVAVDNMVTGRHENLESVIDKIEFHDADVCVLGNARLVVEGCDCVLHQAALGSVPRSVKDPLTTNHNNTASTLAMLQAANEYGVKRFVYASSASIYGDVGEVQKVEGMPARPANPYAVSKMAGEEYVKMFSRMYGLETVSLRYFNVFGPRQDPNGQYAAVVPKFIAAMMRSEVPGVYGNGEQFRDFTYVENVVRANLLACEPGIPTGGYYNVGAGGRMTINRLFGLIARELEMVAQPRYEKARMGDVFGSIANIGRAERDLGYSPSFSAEEGIHRTVQWFAERR